MTNNIAPFVQLMHEAETVGIVRTFFFHGGDGGGGLSSQGVTPNPIRYHRSSGFVEPPVFEALRPRSCHPSGVTILCKLPTPVGTLFWASTATLGTQPHTWGVPHGHEKP